MIGWLKQKLEQESQLKQFPLYLQNSIYDILMYGSGACWCFG